jgi:hypothetical protein
VPRHFEDRGNADDATDSASNGVFSTAEWCIWSEVEHLYRIKTILAICVPLCRTCRVADLTETKKPGWYSPQPRKVTDLTHLCSCLFLQLGRC